MAYCIILAGDSEKDAELCELGASANVTNKALLHIDGKPMIQYIVSALDESELVSEMVVVGNEPELKKEVQIPQKKCEIISSASSGKVLDNLLAGVDFLNPSDNILVVTSDIPLLTADAIDNFLNNCNDEKDLFFPVILKEINEQFYPEVERTYVTLTDGLFTGGNVFYINSDKIRPCYNTVDRVLINRKNPLLMAMNFGVGFVGQFLLGKLSLQRAEQKISQILNVDAQAIISDYPELGIDIDKTSDFRLAQKIIVGNKLYA